MQASNQAQQQLAMLCAKLKESGMHVSIDSLRRCIDEEGAPRTVVGLEKHLIDCDVKDYGEAVLPSSLLQKNTPFVGPLVLQISSVTDIGKPATKSLFCSTTKHSLLLLRLTDGHTSCKAIEYRSVPGLGADLVPGTKLRLSRVPVKNGFLLLSRDNCQIVGGHVPSLMAAWKMRKEGEAVKRALRAGGTSEAPSFVLLKPSVSQQMAVDHSTGSNFGSRSDQHSKQISQHPSTSSSHVRQTERSNNSNHRSSREDRGGRRGRGGTGRGNAGRGRGSTSRGGFAPDDSYAGRGRGRGSTSRGRGSTSRGGFAPDDSYSTRRVENSLSDYFEGLGVF